LGLSCQNLQLFKEVVLQSIVPTHWKSSAASVTTLTATMVSDFATVIATTTQVAANFATASVSSAISAAIASNSAITSTTVTVLTAAIGGFFLQARSSAHSTNDKDQK
jgi:hypothetical protein